MNLFPKGPFKAKDIKVLEIKAIIGKPPQETWLYLGRHILFEHSNCPMSQVHAMIFEDLASVDQKLMIEYSSWLQNVHQSCNAKGHYFSKVVR